ncbi:MAG: hypothetical protein JOZ49_04270 [Mycolicibacterium sp.]|nr:hypothetical protein [Mycolicibacterium sp.]
MLVRMGRDPLMTEEQANHLRVACAPSAETHKPAATVKVTLLGAGGEPSEPPT